jgi:HAD superfamily hydrolase (TIGR01549 family)
MAQRIDGILFDLGDTLLDFGEVDVATIFESAARQTYDYLTGLGVEMPSFASYHRRQYWAVRWHVVKSRLTRREFNALDLIVALTARLGRKLTAKQAEELAWLWYKPLGDCAVVEDGARDMLAGFREAGLKLGLVSNTFIPGETLDRHLRMVGLLALLPVRIYSCDVRYRKPNVRIFQAALEAAGLEAKHAFFVGDSLRADILGANRAGLISVLKDPHGRHAGSRIRPRHRIRRLAELPGLLEAYETPAALPPAGGG